MNEVNKMSNRLSITGLFLILVILAGAGKCRAQLYPLAAQYYDNEYIGNPALAGMADGLRFDFSYRKQWNDVPGAPIAQIITGVYRTGRVAAGLNMQKNLEGLLSNTRVVGTFAYHFPLNPRQKLHFGISTGFINQRIRNEAIKGDPGDVSVENYNIREIYLDGDFGMAFTDHKLKIQVSIPNLKSFFATDLNRTADLAVFYSAASYKFKYGEGINTLEIEPKLCYRGVKGFRNMWDAGNNVSFYNNRLNLLAIYHSTGSGTFGFGFNYNESLRLSSMFTTGTSALIGFDSTGDFEINLRLSL